LDELEDFFEDLLDFVLDLEGAVVVGATTFGGTVGFGVVCDDVTSEDADGSERLLVALLASSWVGATGNVCTSV